MLTMLPSPSLRLQEVRVVATTLSEQWLQSQLVLPRTGSEPEVLQELFTR